MMRKCIDYTAYLGSHDSLIMHFFVLIMLFFVLIMPKNRIDYEKKPIEYEKKGAIINTLSY